MNVLILCMSYFKCPYTLYVLKLYVITPNVLTLWMSYYQCPYTLYVLLSIYLHSVFPYTLYVLTLYVLSPNFLTLCMSLHSECPYTLYVLTLVSPFSTWSLVDRLVSTAMTSRCSSHFTVSNQCGGQGGQVKVNYKAAGHAH